MGERKGAQECVVPRSEVTKYGCSWQVHDGTVVVVAEMSQRENRDRVGVR